MSGRAVHPPWFSFSLRIARPWLGGTGAEAGANRARMRPTELWKLEPLRLQKRLFRAGPLFLAWRSAGAGRCWRRPWPLAVVPRGPDAGMPGAPGLRAHGPAACLVVVAHARLARSLAVRRRGPWDLDAALRRLRRRARTGGGGGGVPRPRAPCPPTGLAPLPIARLAARSGPQRPRPPDCRRPPTARLAANEWGRGRTSGAGVAPCRPAPWSCAATTSQSASATSWAATRAPLPR